MLDARNLTTIPRLTVLVGKGGVGRTTLAAALGRVAARRGRRTLLIEVSAHQAIPALFGREGLGYAPVPLADNLWAMRVTWEDALREYGLMKLRLRTAYRLVFENPFMRRLLPAVPGIAEILVIGKIVHAATDGIQGPGAVDAVILDAPATGHGLSLVGAPAVVAGTVAAGPLADDARHLHARLLDSAFTRFHIVATPEEMPVTESVELYRRLGVEDGMPLGPMLVNQVSEPGLTSQQVQSLAAASGSAVPAGVCSEIQAARFMTDTFEMQRGHITRLRGQVPLPVVLLPDVRGVRDVPRRVEVLADHLDARFWREAR